MRLLREPLVHFALAGGLLFGAYSWLNRGGEGEGGADRSIRVTEGDLAWIVETSTRQWQRPPTPDELRNLVAEYVREELLAREARELELDRDDTIVRRRLAQKMTFFLEDTARAAEPPEAELRALFERGRKRYETPPRTTFEQIYFNPERRGERAADDARRTLAALAKAGAAAEWTELGDRTLLPQTLADADDMAVSGQFGGELARAVAALAPGAWQGPIASEFGLHLIRVTARTEAEPRSFEEVRSEVVEAWRRDREAKAKATYFAGLLEKYDVEVDETVSPLLLPLLESIVAARAGTAAGAESGAPE
jgi:hypothetical protein